MKVSALNALVTWKLSFKKIWWEENDNLGPRTFWNAMEFLRCGSSNDCEDSFIWELNEEGFRRGVLGVKDSRQSIWD